MTYLRTWPGWLYLAAVQDAYSRAIVGWSMAEHMRAEFVVDALQMAVARRRPEPGLIPHSDQGSQYVSLAFGQAAREAGIARSMGSKGDAYENAVAESFGMLAPLEFENSTLMRDGVSVAASRLSYSQNQFDQQLEPKAQPCPANRGNSTCTLAVSQRRFQRCAVARDTDKHSAARRSGQFISQIK